MVITQGSTGVSANNANSGNSGIASASDSDDILPMLMEQHLQKEQHRQHHYLFAYHGAQMQANASLQANAHMKTREENSHPAHPLNSGIGSGSANSGNDGRPNKRIKVGQTAAAITSELATHRVSATELKALSGLTSFQPQPYTQHHSRQPHQPFSQNHHLLQPRLRPATGAHARGTPLLHGASTPAGVDVLAMAAASASRSEVASNHFHNPLSDVRRKVFPPTSSFPTPQSMHSRRVTSSDFDIATLHGNANHPPVGNPSITSPAALTSSVATSPPALLTSATSSIWAKMILQVPVHAFHSLDNDTLDRLSVHIDRLRTEIQAARSPAGKKLLGDPATSRVSPLSSIAGDDNASVNDPSKSTNNNVSPSKSIQSDSTSSTPPKSAMTPSSSTEDAADDDQKSSVVATPPATTGKGDPTTTTTAVDSNAPNTLQLEEVQRRHERLVQEKACLKCHKTGWVQSFTNCCCRHHQIQPNCLVCDDCHGSIDACADKATADHDHKESSNQANGKNKDASTVAPSKQAPQCDFCKQIICIHAKTCSSCPKQLCSWCSRRHMHSWEQCKSKCGPHCKDCKDAKLLKDGCNVCHEALCSDCDYQRCRWCTEVVCKACSPKVWTVSNILDADKPGDGMEVDQDAASDGKENVDAAEGGNGSGDRAKQISPDSSGKGTTSPLTCLAPSQTQRPGSFSPPASKLVWLEEDNGRNGPGACIPCMERARKAGYFYFHNTKAAKGELAN